MNTTDVMERLKQIGPYVSHATTEVGGKPCHIFTIGSAPAGRDAYRAGLYIPYDVNMDEMDWKMIIHDGKLRYADCD